MEKSPLKQSSGRSSIVKLIVGTIMIVNAMQVWGETIFKSDFTGDKSMYDGRLKDFNKKIQSGEVAIKAEGLLLQASKEGIDCYVGLQPDNLKLPSEYTLKFTATPSKYGLGRDNHFGVNIMGMKIVFRPKSIRVENPESINYLTGKVDYDLAPSQEITVILQCGKEEIKLFINDKLFVTARKSKHGEESFDFWAWNTDLIIKNITVEAGQP